MPSVWRCDAACPAHGADAHDLNECANRVMESPVACRRVLDHLAELARNDQLNDPKWSETVRSLTNLITAVTPRRR